MSVVAPLKLAVLACAGVGGTCSVVYAGSSWLSGFSGLDVEDDSIIQTVSDKFSSRLIAKGKDSVWQTRLDELRKHKGEELDKDLKAIRDDSKKKKEDLRDWCEAAKIKPNSGEGSDLLVKGVEAYCTYVIKDQVSRAVNKNDEETWKPINKRLMEYQGSLSNEMQKLKEKVKDENSIDLKQWCFESYKKPFKDKNDQLYKDVSTFCVSVKVAKKPAAEKSASEAQSTQPGST
ncbi:hypothetical protein MHC_02885 [Mycoplasma haemocanis str. Illinois]|uniref:Uncharacterized protein n=1 Tax=Mycoplasma haemocanis (strain Illinois) TaxID=1111676 RepID=H6N717_MYCHN|nr:hypothetical protein [Mycoplasma haemocanis]AEW45439.1 hypothetical protein MHC_02885 [Mycoplasma haemocanis str. Illinois]